MELNYLAAFAFPAFFIFLGLEYGIALKRKRADLFKLENSIANLSIGIAERLLNLFISGSFYGVFYWIYTHYAVFDIPNVWWVWILLFLVTDFVWYWYHRLGHEINILWAAHIVHHQSEDFNYTVSARITVFQALIRNIFWCLLPLIGFHPNLILTILVAHGAYSFFTHTQLVGTLGVLDKVFISPSLHGVHHASNEKYLNKNYGDLFVFWDKLFGTFQAEDKNEKPVYGLTHPLNSHSFLWQHFHYYLEILAACRNTPGLFNKLKIVFGNPDTLDQNLRPQLEKVFLPNKSNDTKLNNRFKTYIITQIVVATILLFLITLFFEIIGLESKIAGTLFVLLTLVNCGALLEQRNWLYNLEKFRLFILISYLSLILNSTDLFFIGLIIVFALDYILPFKKIYFSILQYNPKE